MNDVESLLLTLAIAVYILLLVFVVGELTNIRRALNKLAERNER